MILDKSKNESIIYEDYTITNFINTIDIERKLILDWRNDENVRKWMVNKNIISYNEHLNYINSLKNNNQKLCFLVKDKESYLGIVEFDEINLDEKSTYFGLNSNPKNEKPGLGRILEEISIYLAKEKLGLEKLKLFVFIDNKQVINLHKKYGFVIVNEKDIEGRKAYFMEKLL